MNNPSYWKSHTGGMNEKIWYNYILSMRGSHWFRDANTLKLKNVKYIFYTNIRDLSVSINIRKSCFNHVTRVKGLLCVILLGSIHQEEIQIIEMHAKQQSTKTHKSNTDRIYRNSQCKYSSYRSQCPTAGLDLTAK